MMSELGFSGAAPAEKQAGLMDHFATQVEAGTISKEGIVEILGYAAASLRATGGTLYNVALVLNLYKGLHK